MDLTPTHTGTDVWIVLTEASGELEVLDSAPLWNWQAMGQRVWFASVNGGDSVELARTRPAGAPLAEGYRETVRGTFRRLSDRALAYQAGVIVGGIDREECEAELRRRAAGGSRVAGV
jgi:hypothetical protein